MFAKAPLSVPRGFGLLKLASAFEPFEMPLTASPHRAKSVVPFNVVKAEPPRKLQPPPHSTFSTSTSTSIRRSVFPL
jgi:hypothetical protein